MLRALDLFCGAGGVSAGLVAAGFHVVGVDIKPAGLLLLPWQTGYRKDHMPDTFKLTTIPTEGYLCGWAVMGPDGFEAFCLVEQDAALLFCDSTHTVAEVRPALLTPDGVIVSTGELATHEQIKAVYRYQRVALLNRKVG